ncbi:hypothetical protein HYALB_00005446 [Hymenoscyphus albidus]|uniref:Ubiquitin-like domain-containing protein n=1 Tax=Hymenoscyphus albidus TaxID=595503 RepID=A0A9N9PXB1_9HELO|nr:hypothetical protein HYALB_00005446 [Hymenoscyphus albidus]
MAASFGFSAGDFIVVGQLVHQIARELRQNGEAAPEYQLLLPAKIDFLRLNAIRAAALSCQIPLQAFLKKISKFDNSLGIANARNLRFRGLPRRLQWSLAYRDDVKELRGKLGSFVATINLLLMTQAVAYITAADGEREETKCGLLAKILENRRRLEKVEDAVSESSSMQAEMGSRLQHQEAALQEVFLRTEITSSGLHDLTTESFIAAKQRQKLLTIATNTLFQATLGLLTLRDIAVQIRDLVSSFAKFTSDMRESVVFMISQFTRIFRILERLETKLADRICPPIVRFTDALGIDFALPYQACLQWASFQMILRAIFEGRPGKSRVDKGMFRIINTRTGRIANERSWHHVPIRENDHIEMSVVFKRLLIANAFCPFSGCESPVWHSGDTESRLVCHECGCSMNSDSFEEIKDEEKNYSSTGFPDVTNASYNHTKEPQENSQKDSHTGSMTESTDAERVYRIFCKITLSPILPGDLVEAYLDSLNSAQLLGNLTSVRLRLFPDFDREILLLIQNIENSLDRFREVKESFLVHHEKAEIGMSYCIRIACSYHKTMRDMRHHLDNDHPPQRQWLSMIENLHGQGGMTLTQRFQLFCALWDQIVFLIDEYKQCRNY